MNLVVTSTYFQVPEKWYYNWQRPRFVHLHLLYYILTRECDLNDVKSTRVICGPECSTDHYMVRSTCALECAINSMKTNEAPGIDGIPTEVCKHGGTLLKENLLKLIQKCWEEQILLQDFKYAVLILIYKNTGDRRDCSNYRGLSLFSVAGRILAKILQ